MKCDRCNLNKPNELFESLKNNKRKNNTHSKLKTCMDCRNQISANNKLKKSERKNKSIIANQENAIAPEDLVDFIFNALPEDYDSDEYLFEKRFFIILDPLLNNVDTNLKDQVNNDKEVAQQIIKLISKADGFSWIYHKCSLLKDSISFVYYCNCCEELKNKKAWVANISSQCDMIPRIVQYSCDDTIQINIKRIYNWAVINIYHYFHPLPEAMEVSSQIRNYIINNNLLTVPQLYSSIKEEKINGFLYITRQQKIIQASNLFIKINIHWLFNTIDIYIANKATKTIIVDSTYGTNRLKFELFAVLGVIDSAGFSLSYFFLKPKHPHGKTQAITTWFKNLKENGIQNIETILTNKDRGQIIAIKKIWTGTKIQLCYWHVIRAIKKKLSSTRIVHNYYNAYEAHLLCPTINPAWQPVNQNQPFMDLTNQEHSHDNDNKKQVFCQKSFRKSILQMEQYDYCYKNNLKHVWSYLWSEWYYSDMWKLWSQSSNPKLSVLRSTMAIEIIPRQIDRLQLFRNNRCMPKWRENFRLEWKNLATKTVNSNSTHITDSLRWICSCYGFLLNRFHICKHLVQMYGLVEPGFFKKVTHQEYYPLLEIREENAFADLPEDIYIAIKNLNSYICELITSSPHDDNQVHEQESVTISSNEYSMDIVDNNQDLILFQTRKEEIFNLLDETKNIFEKNIANPNKWLNSIEKNFELLRKLVENCKRFERQNHIPNTWKNRNSNTFWL
ncbi:21345_t:CDS:2 [Gigaspora rosea]|nr:21345_t:CDS:2 [Gigaspora rosea]